MQRDTEEQTRTPEEDEEARRDLEEAKQRYEKLQARMEQYYRDHPGVREALMKMLEEKDW